MASAAPKSARMSRTRPARDGQAARGGGRSTGNAPNAKVAVEIDALAFSALLAERIARLG
jgi:hypothetical protein